MPIKTLVACAAASAAAGSALTAAILTRKTTASSMATAPSSSAASKPAPPAPLPLPLATPVAAAAAAATLNTPVNPTGVFQYGFPGPTADLRPTPSLVSVYDRRTRNPHWVAEHITPASLALKNADRRHSAFYEDSSIPAPFRAKLSDYARSGYDRGHQVPAADAKWSQDAMDATFSLSNMCPQVGEGFNRDYWAHFEDFCRRLTTRYPSVRVVTGPLYLPKRDPVDGKYRVSYEVIGSPPNVAVPTHFYKVIYGEDGTTGGNVALGAFVLPNAPIANARPLGEFEVPVEIVERASGLEFATKLPTARRKRLCAEVDCGIVVKEYAERQKTLGQ